MAIRINDNSLNVSGELGAQMGSFSSGLAGGFTGPGTSSFDGSINRALGSFVTSFTDRTFPINGWASYGGYMIANQSQNLEDEPYKT